MGEEVEMAYPASQAVGDVAGVAVRRDAVFQLARRGDGARVVDASGFVVPGDDVSNWEFDGVRKSRGGYALADIGGLRLAQGLLEPVAGSGSRRAVLNHLRDLRLRAGVLHAAVVAGAGAVVRLHETRVVHAVVSSWSSYTPL